MHDNQNWQQTYKIKINPNKMEKKKRYDTKVDCLNIYKMSIIQINNQRIKNMHKGIEITHLYKVYNNRTKHLCLQNKSE